MLYLNAGLDILTLDGEKGETIACETSESSEVLMKYAFKVSILGYWDLLSTVNYLIGPIVATRCSADTGV